MVRARLLLVVVLAAAVLGGCRVDVAVDVVVARDGSGTLTVTMTADAEVVAQAGGLADDLRLDDLRAVGWEVVDPVPTDDGGLRLVMAHEFAAPEELNALLATLNGRDGPFRSVTFRRAADDRAITFTISGTGRVDAGLASFADAALVATIGATPYADDVATAGLSQSEAVVVTFGADLPGVVERTTGTDDGERVTWVVPLDSRPVDLSTTARLELGRSGPWAFAAATLQVLFVAWVVVSGVVLVYVPYARWRRARERPRPWQRNDRRDDLGDGIHDGLDDGIDDGLDDGPDDPLDDALGDGLRDGLDGPDDRRGGRPGPARRPTFPRPDR